MRGPQSADEQRQLTNIKSYEAHLFRAHHNKCETAACQTERHDVDGIFPAGVPRIRGAAIFGYVLQYPLHDVVLFVVVVVVVCVCCYVGEVRRFQKIMATVIGGSKGSALRKI